MNGASEQFNIGLCIILFLIFSYLLYVNMLQDVEDEKTLGKIVCHKEVQLPEIRIVDKLIIESVIYERLLVLKIKEIYQNYLLIRLDINVFHMIINQVNGAQISL